MKDVPFLERNHGSPRSARMKASSKVATGRRSRDILFRPGSGMEGDWLGMLGQSAGAVHGNSDSAEVSGHLMATPSILSCSITPAEALLTSRAEVATFSLTVTPPQKPEEISIDSFRGGQVAGRNAYTLDVPGSYRRWCLGLGYRQGGGRSERGFCQAQVTLRFPPTTTALATLPPPARLVTTAPSPAKKKGSHTLLRAAGSRRSSCGRRSVGHQ